MTGLRAASGLCTTTGSSLRIYSSATSLPMDIEQVQEMSRKAAHLLSKRIQRGPTYNRQHIEQQTPTVWCGWGCGEVGGEFHDVTICLVQNGINWTMSDETEHHRREILTVLKVHSSRLRKCSKYFETCLAERWGTPSSDFILETNTDIAFYTDCFSRMYSPTFHKGFKDIKSSLGLLRVASEIQFHDLMDSTLLYISSRVWSDEDEVMVRSYAASPDFPRNHAQGLVVRLGMDVSKEDSHKQLCDMVQQCIRSALDYDCSKPRSHRKMVRELLPDGGASADSHITRDVVMLFIKEAKDMLVKVGKECDGQTRLSVPRFADKILAVCWMLETLLAAKVAEEVVECFVHLHALPKSLAVDSGPPLRHTYKCHLREHDACFRVQNDSRKAAVELVKLVLVMYREVAAGNLLLKTPERAALLENWCSVFPKFSSKDDFDKAVKDLFSTLPLKKQMELVKARKDSNYEYISRGSLVNLLKRKWPAVDVKGVVSPPPSSS